MTPEQFKARLDLEVMRLRQRLPSNFDVNVEVDGDESRLFITGRFYAITKFDPSEVAKIEHFTLADKMIHAQVVVVLGESAQSFESICSAVEKGQP